MLQLDKEIVQERQERYAQHAPKRVQKALCAEGFWRIAHHYTEASSKNPDKQAAEETDFFLLRKVYLAPCQVATSGHTRMQRLNRVFNFSVQEAVDFSKILSSHPLLADLDSEHMDGRV